MRKNLLTKTCTVLLLALFATAWSSNAWALTINVKASQAPYVYAWNGSTNYNGSYPGNQLTQTRTVGGQTWYYIDIDATSVNIIISNSSEVSEADQSKTDDLEGIESTKYYSYDPTKAQSSRAENLTDYFNYPNGVNDEETPYVYVVNVSGWSKVNAYVWDDNGNNNGTYPGPEMTKIGTNSQGFDVYKWTGATPANPTGVKFSNGNTNSGDLTWTNGAVWSNYNNSFSYQGIVNGVLLDADHFPDANFRTALTTATGVQENGIIATKNVTELDVSNSSISDLEGISNFTNLEELYAQNNSINTSVDLKNNKKLRILNVSGNSAITGFSANHTPYVDINFGNGSNTTNLEELYCANCSIFYAGGLAYNTGLKVLSMPHNVLDYFDATNTMSKLSNLEYLDMSYNKLTSAQSLSNNTKLIYVDVSENPTFKSYFAHLENLTQLKTFKAANCGLTADQTKYSNDNGYFPNESVEYVDVSNNTALNTMYCPATNNLKTIIANGCTDLGGSSSSWALSPTYGGTYLPRMTHLEHLELNNVNLYLNTGNATYGLFSIITPSVAPNLHYIDLSNDQLGSAAKPTFAFPALDTLLINDNPGLTSLTITSLSNPEKLNLDVTNDAALTTLAITNSGMTQSTMPTIAATGATSLYKLDLSDNAFTDVPTTGISSLTTLVMNNNQLSDINVSESNIQYLYAQSNNFASDYTLPVTSLVGLDLGNNGFTKFTATMADAITDEWAIDYTQTPPVTIQANADESDGSNTTLQALHLGGNTSLETVTVNGFKGLTKLASDNDMTSDKGKGLYVKDNTAIKTLDISNNRIEILGQDGSLSGLSALEELNASHNKLLTLTNFSAVGSSSGDARTAYGNGTYIASTCPNIEDLTGLKKLNLSYNLLSDSIHLAKNTNLEWLDVSHNRTITERAAGLTQYYRDTKDGTFKAWKETTWTTEMDQYTNDLNDTIGLRMLDLYNQAKLEYLDISYTNIENTAKTRVHVNNRVGPENLTKNTQASSNGEKVGRWGVPRFVLVNHCSALVEFHTNYNAMKSLGIGSEPESYSSTNGGAITGCPNLEVLEAIECRGQDPKIMQGEITISQRNPKMRYYNVKNSNFDKVNPYSTLLSNYSPSGQNLETLIVDGNYTKDNASHWNLTDAGTLDVSNNPKLVNLQANKCPNLITVKANGLADLDIVSVTQDTTVTTVNNETVTTKLAELYVDHDAILDEVLGLETLSALSVYHANDSHFTSDFVMPAAAKSTLTDLRVGNENLSYAETRNNLTAVNLTDYTAVQHLETQNNPSVAALDITGFKNSLVHIDFANNHIDNDGIGVGNLSELPALTYFSCSNDSKWSENAGNSLTDLILTQSSGIQEIYANNNDLHKITGSFSNLTNIEFAHNHINGIDLSAASENENLDINGEDNGRDILADCAYFAVKENGEVVNYKVYFFQLDPNVTGNGTVLTMKESEDSEGTTRHLGTDGLVMDNITDWTSDAAELTSTNSKGTISPDDMSALDPEQVPGTIVVLKANENGDAAYGTAKYSYDNGTGTASSFYLKWESSGTPTAISEINAEGGVSIANTYGDLTITGKDDTVVGVYDLNGRQVASETISGGKLTIDGLSPGIYIVNGVKVLVK